MLNSMPRTIAGRLYLAASLTLISMLAVASASIYFAVNTRRAAEVFVGRSLAVVVDASEIELLLERHRRLVEAAPLEFDRAQIKRDRADSEVAIRTAEKLVDRAGGEFAIRVGPGLAKLSRQGREVLRLAENFAQDRALQVVASYVQLAKELQAIIRSYRGASVKNAHDEALELMGSAVKLSKMVIGITLLVTLVIGPLAFYLLQGLVTRLREITKAMGQLAHNDTAISLTASNDDDDIGAMTRAVDVFRTNAVALLQHQDRLQELNSWLDIALNNMARGLSLFDRDERLVFCNSIYPRMYDLPVDLTRPGVPFARILDYRRQTTGGIDELVALMASMRQPALAGTGPRTGEKRCQQNLDDGRIIEVSVKPLERGGWVAVHEDVTERHEASARIARLAREDTLTGLANRYRFREELDAMTRGAVDPFALLVIDLDRFKEVNDAYGHPTGDLLLKAVGARLSGLVRQEDLLARLGGDEFAIILRDQPGRSVALGVANRAIEALHTPFQVDGLRLEIGGTVGLALAPDDGGDVDVLMRNADIALYKAKAEARGTAMFFDADMERQLRARRQLESDLEHAVERGQFELYYQPITSLAEGRVICCEALIRWRHPVRGMVSPAEFIPIAEETGAIIPIGAWALREACSAAALWPGNRKVAVNLSVAQFRGPSIAEIAEEALTATGLAAGRLELEVTESLLLGNDATTMQMLHNLRALGIGIALDDFGTGHSSLSQLRRFPFDKLKIDQSFVRDLADRPDCEAIVGAVARLAASLEMETVAEGVETMQHLARVQAAGCDSVQGYLFSRPVPGSDIVDVMLSIDNRMRAMLKAETLIAV